MTTAEPLFSSIAACPAVAPTQRWRPVRDPLSVLDEYAAFETIDKLELRDLAAAVNVSHSWSDLIETSGAWKKQYLRLPLLPAEKWRHIDTKFPQVEPPRDIHVGLEGDQDKSVNAKDDTTDWKRLSLTHLATEARWAEGRSTIRNAALPQGGFLQFAGVDEGSDALIFVEHALTIEIADLEEPTPLPSIGGPSRLHVVDRTTLAVRESYPVPHGRGASFGTRPNIGLYINRPINGHTVSSFIPGYTADRFALKRRCLNTSPFQPLLGTEMRTARDRVFPFVDNAEDAPKLMAALMFFRGGDDDAQDAMLHLSHVKAPDTFDAVSEIPMRIRDSQFDVLIDDEFIIVPTGFHVDVYTRAGEHILTYLANEQGEQQRRLAGTLYEIPHQDISQKRYTPLRGSPRVATRPSAKAGTAKSLAAGGLRHGYSEDENERFQRTVDAVFWDRPGPQLGGSVLSDGGTFTTGSTLYICFVGSGTVVIPEYRRVFREAAAHSCSQRAEYVADRAVGLAAPAGSVFVAHGDRFAICQPNEIHLFNVADLPILPLGDGDIGPLRGKTIVGHTNDARYLSRMSPLGFQMDSRAIYELIDVGDPLSGLAVPRYGGYRLPRFGLRVFSFEPKA